MLITDIKTSILARELGLVDASKSMYSDAFLRYKPSIYRKVFSKLLEKLSFLNVPEIKVFGKIVCTDGSIFPAIKTMLWASYKKRVNAIKLHLSFEINRKVPINFISTEANKSEKKILMEMLDTGVTYILDRGYVCFNLFYELCEKGAYFVVRGKSNSIYNICETLKVNTVEQWSAFFSNIKDLKIVFKNDKYGKEYRMIVFDTMGEQFILLTNRFDLKTYEVIMLYAYRWQVELIFRFIKRTMNGIHLMSHDPKGVEIQFILYMISYLLLLAFKQKWELLEESTNKQIINVENESSENYQIISDTKIYLSSQYACGLVSLVGEKLQRYWKIGIHWLTTVRNLFMDLFNPDTIKLIVGIH